MTWIYQDMELTVPGGDCLRQNRDKRDYENKK